MINISREKYIRLVKKAEMNEELLVKLVRGLEDIRTGRIKHWKEAVKD